MQPILIHGAGGHGREVARLIEQIIAAGAPWTLVGFVDDDKARHGTKVLGLPVLGGARIVAAQPGCFMLAMGIGSPRIRRDAVERLKPFVASFPSLVHPAVELHRSVELGSGVQLHEGTIVTVDVSIGDHVICNRRVDVSHDCRLEAFATLAPAVSLAGGVTLGAGADLGIGATCLPCVRVGAWSVVGAGAVVTTEVPGDTTVAGVPARVLEPRLHKRDAA